MGERMSRQSLEALRERYQPGCSVELVSMDDGQAPPEGTRGKVVHVDDLGTVHMLWENGSTLGFVPEVDRVRILTQGMEQKPEGRAMGEKVRMQILEVCDTGLTNMMDVVAVRRIADSLGLSELVTYLDEGNGKGYAHFILTGNS